MIMCLYILVIMMAFTMGVVSTIFILEYQSGKSHHCYAPTVILGGLVLLYHIVATGVWLK